MHCLAVQGIKEGGFSIQNFNLEFLAANIFMKKSLLILLILCVSIMAQTSFTKEYENDPVVCIKTSMGDMYVELFAQEAPKTVQNFIELAEGTKEFTDKDGKQVKRPYYDGLIFHRVIKNFMIQGGCILGTGAGNPGYSFEDEINATALGLHKELIVMKYPEGLGFNPKVQGLGIPPQGIQQIVTMMTLQKLNIQSEEQFKAKQKEFVEELQKISFKDVLEATGYKYNENLKSHEPKRGVIAMANRGPNTNGAQFFINLVDTPWLTGKHTVFGKVLQGMDILDAIGEVEVDPANSKPKKEISIFSIRLVDEKEKTAPAESAPVESAPAN